MYSDEPTRSPSNTDSRFYLMWEKAHGSCIYFPFGLFLVVTAFTVNFSRSSLVQHLKHQSPAGTETSVMKSCIKTPPQVQDLTAGFVFSHHFWLKEHRTSFSFARFDRQITHFRPSNTGSRQKNQTRNGLA